MKYCRLCLQPDSAPSVVFNADGICHACINYSQNKSIDYDRRFRQLETLISETRGRSDVLYDCIIGVSGGKDSTRQALFVRDTLGLNPLLVSLCYPPEQISELGARNLSNLIELGFTVVVSSPAPQTWRSLVREAFLRFANWARATEMALYSSVPRVAVQYGIKTIFIGENQSFRDQKTVGEEGWRYNSVLNQNTLNKGNIDWMREVVLTEALLQPYQYPPQRVLDDNGIQVIDLGWFFSNWDNQTNARFSCLNGLGIRQDSVENTGDPMGVSALDEDWVTLNQMIKYYKFGFGKVTDYMNEAIRLEQISREEAIAMVERYDGACSDEYIESFCSYIDISTDRFWETVLEYTNRKLFKVSDKRKIMPLFKVGHGL